MPLVTVPLKFVQLREIQTVSCQTLRTLGLT